MIKEEAKPGNIDNKTVSAINFFGKIETESDSRRRFQVPVNSKYYAFNNMLLQDKESGKNDIRRV